MSFTLLAFLIILLTFLDVTTCVATALVVKPSSILWTKDYHHSGPTVECVAGGAGNGLLLQAGNIGLHHSVVDTTTGEFLLNITAKCTVPTTVCSGGDDIAFIATQKQMTAYDATARKRLWTTPFAPGGRGSTVVSANFIYGPEQPYGVSPSVAVRIKDGKVLPVQSQYGSLSPIPDAKSVSAAGDVVAYFMIKPPMMAFTFPWAGDNPKPIWTLPQSILISQGFFEPKHIPGMKLLTVGAIDNGYFASIEVFCARTGQLAWNTSFNGQNGWPAPILVNKVHVPAPASSNKASWHERDGIFILRGCDPLRGCANSDFMYLSGLSSASGKILWTLPIEQGNFSQQTQVNFCSGSGNSGGVPGVADYFITSPLAVWPKLVFDFYRWKNGKKAFTGTYIAKNIPPPQWDQTKLGKPWITNFNYVCHHQGRGKVRVFIRYSSHQLNVDRLDAVEFTDPSFV